LLCERFYVSDITTLKFLFYFIFHIFDLHFKEGDKCLPSWSLHWWWWSLSVKKRGKFLRDFSHPYFHKNLCLASTLNYSSIMKKNPFGAFLTRIVCSRKKILIQKRHFCSLGLIFSIFGGLSCFSPKTSFAISISFFVSVFFFIIGFLDLKIWSPISFEFPVLNQIS